MVKDIYLLDNRTKFYLVIISLLPVFLNINFFIMLQLDLYFKNVLDTRLKHELEHIELSAIYNSDSIKILFPTENKESLKLARYQSMEMILLFPQPLRIFL